MLHTGRSIQDIGPILKTNPIFQRGYSPRYIVRQRGRGLGSVFSSVFSYFKPLLAKGLKSIAKEALQAGVDIVENKQGQPFNQIVKERGQEAVKNLAKKATAKIDPLMAGSGAKGIKRQGKSPKLRQSLVAFRKPPRKRKPRKQRKKDIFD